MSLRIALAGNPNSGKTTLFNALTGSNQFVGNWPGVTVEKKEGKLKKHDGVIITDLPGIYSLSPYTLEEVVARNYLIGERPDAILNIVDGANLERNLYLTTQLTELGIPVVIAINMMDVVRKNGDKINTAELSRELGCEIVEISALKGTGIMEAAEYVKIGGESGKVAIIAGLTGADNAQQRTAGFEEELAKYPDIEIVATQYCDWDTQKAQAAAEDIITANPDLKAFLVQDDGMSKGVWNAIEAAGKQDQIIIASQGFYEWSIPYLKEGKFAFTITYPAGFFARDAMNVIKSVSDGETVDRVQWLGMELVTAENADTAAHD